MIFCNDKVQLELSQNALSGLVPNEIFDASNLQKLDLAFQIYNSWNCTRSDGSVVEVYYSKGDPENSGNWGLEGEICDARIGKLQNLTQLLLNDNYFSGSIGMLSCRYKPIYPSILSIRLFFLVKLPLITCYPINFHCYCVQPRKLVNWSN